MQDRVSNQPLLTRVIVSSERLLFADCLSHHFSTAAHRFELVTESAGDTLDSNIPTVYIRDVGRNSYDARGKESIIKHAVHAAPTARLLIVSARLDVREAPDWIALGAHGYFSTRSTTALLTAATIVVASGGLYVPEELTRGFLLGTRDVR